MSDLNATTELWVLRAKVKAYEKALAESMESDAAHGEACIDLAEELHILRDGVVGMARTLRKWAVAAGGHTPSAIVATKLLELVGAENVPPEDVEPAPQSEA